MSTKAFKFTEKKVIRKGPVTTVVGITNYKPDKAIDKAHLEVMRALDEAEAFHWNSCNAEAGFKTAGVAKCNPNDTYDEIFGKVLASKRAEAKGNREARAALVKLLSKVNYLAQTVREAIDELDARHAYLKSDK